MLQDVYHVVTLKIQLQRWVFLSGCLPPLRATCLDLRVPVEISLWAPLVSRQWVKWGAGGGKQGLLPWASLQSTFQLFYAVFRGSELVTQGLLDKSLNVFRAGEGGLCTASSWGSSQLSQKPTPEHLKYGIPLLAARFLLQRLLSLCGGHSVRGSLWSARRPGMLQINQH